MEIQRVARGLTILGAITLLLIYYTSAMLRDIKAISHVAIHDIKNRRLIKHEPDVDWLSRGSLRS